MDLIIFIHGALSSPTSWAYHRKALKSSLKNKIISDFSYDIERSASKEITDSLVQSILDQIKTKTFDRIFLIGHSFGGVVAIAAVDELLNNHQLKYNHIKFKVLTISSPLGGSGAASFFRILKPFSQFLKNIGSFDSFMTRFKNRELPCPVHCITSIAPLSVDYPIKDSDGVVSLESQVQFKDDPNCTLSFVCSNHFEVLLSDDVTTEIKNFIV